MLISHYRGNNILTAYYRMNITLCELKRDMKRGLHKVSSGSKFN